MVDYIVVGGGSTGCTLAGRLSEDSTATVVLLEEGPRDLSPYIHIPGAYYKTAQGGLLKRYRWEPTQAQARSEAPTMVQAKVLGGGSSVNAMIYIRGVPQDYDGWAAMGATGWSYAEVLAYFKKAEDNDTFNNEVHGTGGPLGVSFPPYVHPLSRVWLQACQAQGLPYNADFNSGKPEGCGLYQITARNGLRSSAAAAYVRPARGRGNLSVRTGCKVEQILFDGKVAKGVVYTEKGVRRELYANKEIILSAGAIATPQLLMVSGIGPAEHLQAQGVPLVMDLPGVGRNLQDHIEISMVYELTGPHSYDKYKKPLWKAAAGLQYGLFRNGPAASNLIEAGAFWWGQEEEQTPDIQYFMVVGAGIEEGVDAVPGGNGCTINVGQIRPRSRGYVELDGRTMDQAPRIVPNYFSDPYDLDALVEGFRVAEQIMQQPVFKPFIARRHVPAPQVQSREEIARFCEQIAHAALHPAGTCRMGTDEQAVVCPELRVRGVERLRVADASIMPTLVSGNPNAVCIMIGEKLADMIRCNRHSEIV
ncbi:GMC family oxidoreductase [Pseudomonas faucium]|uniref:GMC family oxidoreductase n=1 Tax=Pseudomonas faucium TaxID=2740518 RepID=UPI001F3BC488|nr:GMC family oxidoreductase N-terminal domain-containing protein [Pseudomonas faucium]